MLSSPSKIAAGSSDNSNVVLAPTKICLTHEVGGETQMKKENRERGSF